MVKLKLQYFSHLKQTAKLLEKFLMLEKIEGKRRSWQQRVRWLDGNTGSMDMNFDKVWKMLRDREVWCAAVIGSQRAGHN